MRVDFSRINRHTPKRMIAISRQMRVWAQPDPDRRIGDPPTRFDPEEAKQLADELEHELSALLYCLIDPDTGVCGVDVDENHGGIEPERIALATWRALVGDLGNADGDFQIDGTSFVFKGLPNVFDTANPRYIGTVGARSVELRMDSFRTTWSVHLLPDNRFIGRHHDFHAAVDAAVWVLNWCRS